MRDDRGSTRVMKAPDVISLGTMLVEIMRMNRDEPLGQVGGTFTGPVPER